MVVVSGSTYPDPLFPQQRQLINLGGLTGKPDSWTPATLADDDPSARTGAVLEMMTRWRAININVLGTNAIRLNAEDIIPREPKEPDDAYSRRIFHAVMPPFIQRLASQAAGTILRRGVHLEGGDQEWFEDWAKDVTGDGTPLNEFAREILVDALLYGHCATLVDYSNEEQPATLADEIAMGRKPYLVRVGAQQIRGWRTVGNRHQAPLTMVRYSEITSIPKGQFGEEIIEQIRVVTEDGYQIWRAADADTQGGGGWELYEAGTHTAGEVPIIPVYSNRIATLVSKPPLEECANLAIAYCQRFTDYMHNVHCGALPLLALKGFDPDSGDTELGISVNTAILLPPDGDATIVSPPSDSYNAQLNCLQTLEEQISTLGVSTLAKQNLTNTTAEAKRLDRIDSDSIMAIMSEDLTRALTDMMRIVGQYAGKEPPTITIPKDFENRLLDGNQITALLQLQMQNQISQNTLLRILREGEVLPPYVDIDEEISRTKDEVDEQFDLELEKAEAMGDLEVEQAKAQGGVESGAAASGSAKGANTLPTPLRPGKHSD